MMNLEPMVLKRENPDGVDRKQSGPDLVRFIPDRLTYLNLTAADLSKAEDPLENLLWDVMFDCFPARRIRRR